MTLQITEDAGGCAFRVRVAPGSGRDEIVGKHGDAIKIRLKAQPVKGKANRALCEFLAERLTVSRRDVEIISGQTSRWKRVRVEGVSADAIRALLSTK